MDEVFCGLPFSHMCLFLSGRMRPCCIGSDIAILSSSNTLSEAINHPQIVEIRKDMIDGRIPEPCKRCYSVEKGALYDHRSFEEDKIRNLSGFEKPSRKDASPFMSAETLRSIEVRFDNTRPNICVMCGASDSSAWENLLRRHKYAEKRDKIHEGEHSKSSSQWILHNLIEGNDSFEKLRHIRIAGGEPFASKMHVPFLSRLVEKGISRRVSLEYITSASVAPGKALELWRHFRAVKFLISADGPSKVNDYIRYPSKLEDAFNFVDDICDAAINKNIEFDFECTVQAANALYIRPFLDSVEDWRNGSLSVAKTLDRLPAVGFHLLRSPTTLSLGSLPDWYLDRALSLIGEVSPEKEALLITSGRRGLDDIKKHMIGSRGGADGHEFLEHLDYLDRKRGTSRFEHFDSDPLIGETVTDVL